MCISYGRARIRKRPRMKNQGKLFEQEWAKSVPDYTLLYRLPDSAQSFGRNSNLRFSNKSPFDYLLWDSHEHILYALELKTVKGHSISFERSKEESKEIHYHQIVGLNTWNSYDGIVGGFLISFRDKEKTVFLPIDSFNRLVETINKKSFNLDDLNNSNLPFCVIPQRKIRTRYTYDVTALLSWAINYIKEKENRNGNETADRTNKRADD